MKTARRLNMQIDLPGLNKEDIEFRFPGDGFYWQLVQAIFHIKEHMHCQLLLRPKAQ
jgi:hypothetical protein